MHDIPRWHDIMVSLRKIKSWTRTWRVAMGEFNVLPDENELVEGEDIAMTVTTWGNFAREYFRPLRSWELTFGI